MLDLGCLFAKFCKLRFRTGAYALIVIAALPLAGVAVNQQQIGGPPASGQRHAGQEIEMEPVSQIDGQGFSQGTLSDVNPSGSYWATGGVVVLFLVLFIALYALMMFSRRLQNEVAVRRSAEAGVRQSEQRLSMVIDQAADMIFFHDMQGRLKIVNQAACDALGYTQEELVQLSVKDIDGQFQEHNDLLQFWESLQDKGSTIFETKLRKRNDGLIPVEINIKLFRYQNEPWLLAVVREIGRRKLAEAQLRRSHKMEALGTLSSGIVHDFNNILGIILGSAELAMDDVPSTNPAHGCLEEIKAATRRARDIVRQVLTFTRKVSEEIKPLELTASVEASLKLVRATVPATIVLSANLPSENIVVRANDAQINQIMVNLCANAAHAMEQSGGKITIDLKCDTLANPTMPVYPEVPIGKWASLTIGDTGPGIAPEIIDRIFDPYFTTQKEGQGTGMGLAVVHGTVKMMGGHVFAQSTMGKGTQMVVLIPVADVVADAPEGKSVRISRGSERILFVDDEPALVRYCKRFLERLGYHVEAYTDPITALASFRARPNRFDLVITDMTMPMMTGDKLAQKMMMLRADIPVVLCTGHSELLDEKSALDIGIKAFHMKPFDRMELASTIRIVLDGG